MSKDKPQRARLIGGILNDLDKYVVSLQEQGIKSIKCPPGTSLGKTAHKRPAPVKDNAPRKVASTAAAASAPTAPAPISEGLKQVQREVAMCRKCRLHEKRNKTVPGQGAEHPDVLFVGEGPGRDEDAQGIAFVGAAGKLLTNIISAMNYEREEVFIANVVKCRPPENRKPLPDEMEACLPYLKAQIAELRPKIIVTLGATALEGLIGPPVSITRQRGKWLEFEGIPLMPTFHPSYLLRNQAAKRPVWEDMQDVLKKLGRKPRKTPAHQAPTGDKPGAPQAASHASTRPSSE